MNSSGNVLSWSLMFKDDSSVLAFLEYAVKRFEGNPTADSAPIAERFHQFPDRKLPDMHASQDIKAQTVYEHGEDGCHGGFQMAEGTLAGRIVGRAIDSDGTLISAGVRSQETYVEDRFEITKAARESFLKAATLRKPDQVFPVPDAFARELVFSAYLGMLDVNPLGGKQIRGTILEENIQFRGRRVEPVDGVESIEIWGHSRCEGAAGKSGRNTDGRDWNNRVALNWAGRVSLENGELKSLVAIGEGEETLHWNHGKSSTPQGEAPRTDVANLPAGRPVQFSGPVRFGITVP